jgi:hypothetical protein
MMEMKNYRPEAALLNLPTDAYCLTIFLIKS